MTALSDIELQCTQQQAEDYLHQALHTSYMPRVEEELVHSRITESEITAAMAKLLGTGAPSPPTLSDLYLHRILLVAMKQTFFHHCVSK